MVHGTGRVVFGVANDYAIEERREYYDTIDRRLFFDRRLFAFFDAFLAKERRREERRRTGLSALRAEGFDRKCGICGITGVF